jgi:hypothetical protein
MVACGAGARSAQITDKQTNPIAVHTTTGLGDRGSEIDVVDLSGLEGMT